MADVVVRSVTTTLPATSNSAWSVTNTDLGGITPKAVMVFASAAKTNGTEVNGALMCSGMASSSTNSYCQTYIAEPDQNRADTKHIANADNGRVLDFPATAADAVEHTYLALTSFGTNGATFNYVSGTGNNHAGVQVTFVFFGGADFQGGVKTFQNSIGDPSPTVTVNGFNMTGVAPEAALIMGGLNTTTSGRSDGNHAWFNTGYWHDIDPGSDEEEAYSFYSQDNQAVVTAVAKESFRSLVVVYGGAVGEWFSFYIANPSTQNGGQLQLNESVGGSADPPDLARTWGIFAFNCGGAGIKVDDIAHTTNGSTLNYTAAGFKPQALIHMGGRHPDSGSGLPEQSGAPVNAITAGAVCEQGAGLNQSSHSATDEDGSDPSNTGSYCRTADTVIQNADGTIAHRFTTAFDADGFDWTYQQNTTAQVYTKVILIEEATQGAHVVNAGSGAITIAAQNATVTKNHRVTAGSGALSIAAQNAASIFKGLTIAAGAGALAIAAGNATITKNHRVEAGSGAVTIAAQNATVSQAHTVNAGTAALTLAAQNATITKNHRVEAGAGAITTAAQNATITKTHRVMVGEQNQDAYIDHPGEWTLLGGGAVENGELILTNSSSPSYVVSTRTYKPNTRYRYRYVASEYTSGTLDVVVGGQSPGSFEGGAGVHEGVVTTSGTPTQVTGVTAISYTGKITELRVWEDLGSETAAQNATIDKSVTITAGSGAVAVAAQNATVSKTRTITAGAGALSIAAQNATLTKGLQVNAGSGALQLAAQNATVTKTHTVTAGAGALQVAAQNAGITKGKQVNATSGALTVSAQNATVAKNHRVVAGAGALQIAAQNATIGASKLVTAGSGAIQVAAQNATVTKNHAVTAGAGAIQVQAQNATIEIGAAKTVNAGSGAVTLAAQSATITKTHSVAAGAGALDVSAQNATVTKGKTVTAGTGALTTAAQNATVSQVHTVTATSAALEIAAQAATITKTHAVTAGSGALAVQAFNATIEKGAAKTVNAGSGAITLAAQNATVTQDKTINAGSGAVTIAAQNAIVSTGKVVQATSGALQVAAQNATITKHHRVEAGSGAIQVAAQNASIGAGKTVNAGTAALTIAAQPATLTKHHRVTATSAAIAIAAQGAVVTKPGSIPAGVMRTPERTWAIESEPRTWRIEHETRSWGSDGGET